MQLSASSSEEDHMMSGNDLAGLRFSLFVDMDVSLPDEVLRHCGSLVHSAQESGHSREDRAEGAGLQPHHGSLWWVNCGSGKHSIAAIVH